MLITQVFNAVCVLGPAVFMGSIALLGKTIRMPHPTLWRVFLWGSGAALMLSVSALFVGSTNVDEITLIHTQPLNLLLALLVQCLGGVIGAFSARYLDGESNQNAYIRALSTVLACVHILLLANHWLLLIAAWASVGMALQPLLCFYPDRPFALLAAHKKRIADRLADLMLLVAAGLAWWNVGNGSLTSLWTHIAQHGMSTTLQLSAILLVLAVALRSALLPIHGWLIQVMEAPTPVSALLHAGVINLGGFVLIRFTPLLEQAHAARVLLMVMGLTTAILAGMVMLTRVSIKVRLAWSTVAQMGFMLLECALGLYTLAALHLMGHSLYKAHAFLSASTIVRQTRKKTLLKHTPLHTSSLVFAPVLSTITVCLVMMTLDHPTWPWWWSCILGLAWAPMLWLPKTQYNTPQPSPFLQCAVGLLMNSGLTLASILAHALPLGIHNTPDPLLGTLTLAGMFLLYLGQAIIQQHPHQLSTWRRWSYAGFYLDEAYTRITLFLWPTNWSPSNTQPPHDTPLE